jgi:antitoxin MazE
MPSQTLKKWGNSPAVRLPVGIMEAAKLHLNQEVEARVKDGRVIIEPVTPQYVLDDLISDICQENLHTEMNFGVPQGKEAE